MPHNEDPLVAVTLRLVGVLDAIREQLHVANNNNAILIRLAQMEGKIMSAISDFAAKQTAFNTRQAESQTAVADAITDLTGDIQTLNDKITELQNSTGGITPEDQASLDDLTTQGEALATKAKALSDALAALAALTPPKPPTTP